MMALCLVAVFALSAVVVTAAQAEGPEWGRCVKLAKKKGKYTDSNCTTLSGKIKKEVFVPSEKGEYEWVPGAESKCYSVKKKKAKYTDSNCTTLSGKIKKEVFVPSEKGEYEKTGGGAFTAAGGKGVLESYTHLCNDEQTEPHECEGPYLPAAVECASETGSGEALGSKEVSNVHVAFHNCVLFESIPCTSPSAAPGEIQTSTLKGELGYIEKAGHKVGVSLTPAAGKEALFAKFDCIEPESFEAEIRVGAGSAKQGFAWKPNPQSGNGGNNGIISPIIPVNTMTNTFEQVYTSTTPGTADETTRNVPDHFEGGEFQALESVLFGILEPENPYAMSWSKAAQEITNVNTNSEGAAEIKG